TYAPPDIYTLSLHDALPIWIAGNFVGINYATNNFLGLGETLSIEAQFGTFQRLYSFGFTKPYVFDRPLNTGFNIFKSEYHFDQRSEEHTSELQSRSDLVCRL